MEIKINAFALCKEIIFDKFSNTFSFIHVLESIRPALYPFCVNALNLGLILDCRKSVEALSLSVACGPQGGIAHQLVRLQLRQLDVGLNKVHVKLGELPLVQPGWYDCTVIMDDGQGQRLGATISLFAEKPVNTVNS
jgi:hypothetical protein